MNISLADLEICQGGGGAHDLQNLRLRMAAIFFFTSFNRAMASLAPPRRSASAFMKGRKFAKCRGVE